MHSNLLIERTEEPMRLFYYFLEGRCLFRLDAGDGARICFSRWSTRTTQLPRRMRSSVSWTTSTAVTNSGPAPNKKKLKFPFHCPLYVRQTHVVLCFLPSFTFRMIMWWSRKVYPDFVEILIFFTIKIHRHMILFNGSALKSLANPNSHLLAGWNDEYAKYYRYKVIKL